jgi:hypothetical protein
VSCPSGGGGLFLLSTHPRSTDLKPTFESSPSSDKDADCSAVEGLVTMSAAKKTKDGKDAEAFDSEAEVKIAPPAKKPKTKDADAFDVNVDVKLLPGPMWARLNTW